MLKKNWIVFSLLFFLSFTVGFSIEKNLFKNVIVKTKPKTKNEKRLRLTDVQIDKAWKGQKGKNVLKIDLGSVQKVNSIRFQVKKDIVFNKIKIKAGETSDNIALVFERENGSAVAGEWVLLAGFNIKARYINLVLKSNKNPKIYEIEAFAVKNDFNGDGFSDFLVSAYTHDAGGTLGADRGRVYVFLGGSTLSTVPVLTLSGDNFQGYFGISAAGIGDMNNDGYDDFAIGSSGFDAFITNGGRLDIFLGGPSLSSTPFVSFFGDENGAFLGISVAGVGDVNSDGFDDFMVGAIGVNQNGTDQGQAVLYLGSSNLLTSLTTLEFNGDEDFSNFGVRVAGLGDINNDGFDDFAIGASLHSGGGTDRGRAYIYLGGTTVDSAFDLILNGVSDSSGFGNEIAGVGDYNRDGFDDFMVTAYLDNVFGLGPDRGRLYGFFGGSSLDLTSDFGFAGGDNDQLGVSADGLGDVNNDGWNEYIVGAHLEDAGGNNKGGAHITNSQFTTLDFNGIENEEFFGVSVVGLGDVNNDGYNDFMVGASGKDSGGTDRGAVLIYLGRETVLSLPTIPLTALIGDEDSDGFGANL